MTPRTLYPKQYTHKEWNRFSIEIQEKLCQKYNIFLVNKKQEKITPAGQSIKAFFQQDKKDMAVQILKNINKKNLDKSLDYLHQGTAQISKFAGNFSANGFTTMEKLPGVEGSSLTHLLRKNHHERAKKYNALMKNMNLPCFSTRPNKKTKSKSKKQKKEYNPLKNVNDTSFFSKKKGKFF